MVKAADIQFEVHITGDWTETFIRFSGKYNEFHDMASYVFVDSKRELKVVKYFTHHVDGPDAWPVYHRVGGYASMTFALGVLKSAHSYYMGTEHSDWGPSSYEFNRITKATKTKYHLHNVEVSEDAWLALRGSTEEDLLIALELMKNVGEGQER